MRILLPTHVPYVGADADANPYADADADRMLTQVSGVPGGVAFSFWQDKVHFLHPHPKRKIDISVADYVPLGTNRQTSAFGHIDGIHDYCAVPRLQFRPPEHVLLH